METPRDEQLAGDLRALRSTPRPEFAAELDERAAAGFPGRSRLPRLSFGNLQGLSVRRLLIPAGGVAVIAVAIATAFIASNESEQSSPRALFSQEASKPSPEPLRPQNFDGAGRSGASADAPSAASAAGGSTGAAPEEVAPAAEGLSASAGGAANSTLEPFSREVPTQLRRRAVERSAELVLAAAPADVADDSAAVFEAVHAHDGIVMRSSTREGEPGVAAARFELLIPSGRLSDALAALSEIDEVRSRHEATTDITAPTVNVGELLQDSKARIDSLLAQLEAAETESEREAVEAELRQERRHRALLRSRFQDLQRRADLSRVLVRIETGASEDSSSGGVWGVDDALGDAGQILAVAAAVTVVALAVLGPIALVALLAWLTHRAWVRRERRRVLG